MFSIAIEINYLIIVYYLHMYKLLHDIITK